MDSPNSPQEQQADQLARQAMHRPATFSSIASDCKSTATPLLTPSLAADLQQRRGRGQPLSPGDRRFFESRFGRDLSRVRIHRDSFAANSAEQLNAKAYTIGQDVFLGSGQSHTANRELLAHELVHTIQQKTTAVPTVQRKLKCHEEPVLTECAGAAAKCQSVSSYCAQKYKKASDIARLHAEAKAGAKQQQSSLPLASENLLHFLGGSGTEKMMAVSAFENHPDTTEQLEQVHREKFLAGVQKRTADGSVKVGGSVQMVWTDTASAFSAFSKDDLGLAVGGYTLCSQVEVSTRKTADGKVEVSFDSWEVRAFDCYNWDPGKAIPFFGGVQDNDLCCLENANKGKHFLIRTKWWSNSHSPSRKKGVISGPPSPSAERPPKKR
ncbi:MAG: DUF4157 domain-containing protein [Planctomycetaceae bacterium]|nr:DUF4157 domain-containing protein [Planctomycetaceae bacterium]